MQGETEQRPPLSTEICLLSGKMRMPILLWSSKRGLKLANIVSDLHSPIALSE